MSSRVRSATREFEGSVDVGQGLGSAFLVFDIGIRANPALDLAIGFTDGDSAGDVPAVVAVATPKPEFGFICSAAGQGGRPSLSSHGHVVRMNYRGPSVAVEITLRRCRYIRIRGR